MIDGRETAINGGFEQSPDGHYAFQVAQYQREAELIIDPAVELRYSTYLGGAGEDRAISVAVDQNGSIYMAGNTLSTDFPLGQSHAGEYQSGYDVFVSKLSPDGQTLIYSAYIGGGTSYPAGSCDPDDHVQGIAVNASGEAHLAGGTLSADFPMVNGFQSYVDHCSNYDGFVLRLSEDGQDILYSTYIGGNVVMPNSSGGNDYVYAMAMDMNGHVYITGRTQAIHAASANPIHFPEKNALYPCNAGRPIFISKLDTSKTGDESLVFSTCFGGNSSWKSVYSEEAYAIAVDAASNIYIAGIVEVADFPTTSNAFRTPCVELGYGEKDHAFLSKFSPDAQSLLYSSCFGYPAQPTNTGAPGVSWATDLAVNNAGLAYLVGESRDPQYPLKHQFLSSTGLYNAVFMSIIDTTASGEESLVTSTYLGARPPSANGGESPAGVALDNQGYVYVLGNTDSESVPVADSFQNSYGGGASDCFLSKVSPDGCWLYYNTYLGGSGADYCSAVASDGAGNVVVAGHTSSTNFPTETPLQTTLAGSDDAFLSRINMGNREGLMVKVWGPARLSPGERVTFVVDYKNATTVDAQDVVVQVALPSAARYGGCSEGGIYRSEYEEVFWKLGTVPAGGQGMMTVTVEYLWGLPAHLRSQIVARICAVNSPVHLLGDINNYLDYVPVETVSKRSLSQAEITALLDANPELKALYQQGLARGFVDHGVGSEMLLSNGFLGTSLSLLKADTSQVLFLRQSNGLSLAELYDPTSLTYDAFDMHGGLTYNMLTMQPRGWGAWTIPAPATRELAAATTCEDKKNLKDCLDRCYEANGHKGLQDLLSDIKQMNNWYTCYRCMELNDQAECPVCLATLGIYAQGEDLAYWRALKCYEGCKQDPGRDLCTQNVSQCTTGWNGYSLFRYDASGKPRVAFKRTRTCDPVTCTLGPWSDPISCGDCSSCSNGICLHGAYSDWHLFYGECHVPEVIVAFDPNAKHGFDGDVVPAQTLDYTIEYENLGQGSAYSVFILDQLDPNLDEATLIINNGGAFSDASRSITWDIGTLDPNGTGTYKGAVSYSIQVKANVASGTEIINMASVYFPSVPQVTPTNPVVNRVYAIAAHPQKLEVESGAALPVTLTGLDAGGVGLTFRVVEDPKYGTLTGTPPDVTYTSMAEYNGPDRFRFVANNGSVDSPPADVAITVLSSAADASAPMVLTVYPGDQATGIPVALTPIAENAYAPLISARFSEPVDPATVTAGSFTLASGAGAVAGTINHDVMTRTAYFVPSAPLTHSTTYTATITPAVTGNNGNPLTAERVWQFTTNTEVDIKVLLAPPEATSYDFGNVPLGTAGGKAVSVTSAGTADLIIGSLALTGAGKDHFRLQTDGCTGKTLQAGESCSAQVVFDPLMAGPETATLLVPSTDPDESLITVALRGVGLASGFGVKPSKGTIGTRVKLTGSNLGQSSGAIYVGNSKCKVSSWSALAVNGTVSGPRKPGKYDVRIQPAGEPAMTLSKVFSIMAPAIKSVKPASGSGGGKITVKGKYFGIKAGKVLVGTTRCCILKWSMLPASGAGSIVAEVPAGLAPGSYDVTVVNKVGKARKNGAFKVN